MEPSFRNVKRQARAIIHDTLAEVVIYIQMKEAELQTPTVRLHLTFNDIGDLRRAGFAEQIEQTPKIIFLNGMVTPIQTAVIVTDSQGAYQISRVHPADDITTKTDVVKLPTGQYAAWGLVLGDPWCGLPAPVPISDLPIPQPPQYGTPPTWTEDEW